MLEKLIQGRFIDLDIKVLNVKPPALANAAIKPPHGSFVDSTVLALSLQQSVSEKTGIFSHSKTSAFAPGVNAAKVHRNFHWLKWIPPYTAQIPLGGVDILTGPMSGCWVIPYRWPGTAATDPIHVGHLGTCGNKEWDDGMKAGWNQFAANHPNALISGFQPNRAFANDLDVGPGEFTNIFALVTPDRRYHAVKLGRVGIQGSKFRIVKVKEVTPTVGAALQTIFA